jgi:hypothetical protein
VDTESSAKVRFVLGVPPESERGAHAGLAGPELRESCVAGRGVALDQVVEPLVVLLYGFR